MTEGNFVDYVKYLFRRKRRKRIYAHREIIEKRPDGGDGGRGGHVFLVVIRTGLCFILNC
jgi:GTP-binding protein